MNTLDAFINSNQNNVFSHLNGTAISREQLLSHALFISQQLPDKAYAINLCSSRYLFIVCYLAVIMRKQINLLPANQAQHSIDNLLQTYPDSYYISDSSTNYNGSSYFIEAQSLAYTNKQISTIDPDQTVSISFTSGTTGQSKAVHKNWREFQQSAQLAINRFDLNQQPLTIISTVPPQHMYGLETSIYWPLFSNAAIANCHPFFPEDIRQATQTAPSPCLLISTPAHLKACVRANLEWQNIASVLSSTAPMDRPLAEQIEATFNAPLYEVFGSTETLSFASRRILSNEYWQPYSGISVFKKDRDYYLQGGHLARPCKLDDQLAITEHGSFKVTGRNSDIIKIAGKRASLTELNQILNQIEGVEEGVFYQKNNRLIALVVSYRSDKALLDELRKFIDAVFLPRSLHRVDQLPRNSVGKISKEKIELML